MFLRDASVQTTDSTVRGIHQPMRVAGLAYGDAAVRPMFDVDLLGGLIIGSAIAARSRALGALGMPAFTDACREM